MKVLAAIALCSVASTNLTDDEIKRMLMNRAREYAREDVKIFGTGNMLARTGSSSVSASELSGTVSVRTGLKNLFYSPMLRVGLYVFRSVFNRRFNLTAVFKAKRHYDVQIAWGRNLGSQMTNLTTGNRVLFYTAFYVFAI